MQRLECTTVFLSKQDSRIDKGKLMQYVVLFEKGENSYGAYVPDLPGCVAAAKTLDEVQILIAEAIEFHIEGLQEQGETIPIPSQLSDIQETLLESSQYLSSALITTTV